MSEIQNRIIGIIAEKAGLDASEVTAESFFEDDLNIGDIEKAEILADLEESLEIEDLLENKDDIEAVNDLLELVTDKLE